MKQRVRGLAALPFLSALLGLTANTFAGCATGSDASAESDSDSGSSSADGSTSNGDAASAPDAALDADRSVDADSRGDSSGDVDSSTGIDSGVVDSGTGGDSGVVDAGADVDSGSPDAGSPDAAPTVAFGPDCPSGTTYTEPFTSDPVADGTFLPLAGSSTYDAVHNTVSLASSSANTQLWIGPRPTWASYTVSARVRIDATTSNGNGGFTFRMESTPASPSNNAGQMYYAGIATNQVILGIENGNWTEFSGPSATFVAGTFYTLSVTASGSALSVSVDGTTYITNYADATYTLGSIGLRTYASAMTYGAITVTCL
jgi:hypothetical protein